MQEIIDTFRAMYFVIGPGVILLGGLWWLFKIRQDSDKNTEDIKEIKTEMKEIKTTLESVDKTTFSMNKEIAFLKKEIEESKNQIKDVSNKIDSLIISNKKQIEKTKKATLHKNGKKL